MSDRDCHWSWALLSPTGWVGEGPVDIDYTSGIDSRHERRAGLFKGIPPREYDAAYFVFVDSFSSMSRAAIKIHLLEEVNRIRHREGWPKRIHGKLYTENMIDFAMCEAMDPRLRKIPDWWQSIADVSRREWELAYSTKYERIWRILSDWAWAADEKVWRNEKKMEETGNYA